MKNLVKNLVIDYCSDMVATPDFKFGAMENWGLILYRETKVLALSSKLPQILFVKVLYSDEKTNSRAKQGIAYVVAHELAHQVFQLFSYASSSTLHPCE